MRDPIAETNAFDLRAESMAIKTAVHGDIAQIVLEGHLMRLPRNRHVEGSAHWSHRHRDLIASPSLVRQDEDEILSDPNFAMTALPRERSRTLARAAMRHSR